MAGVRGMHTRSSTSPTHAEAVRTRIKGSLIAEQLQNHALGKVEMTATQVSAALGLLRKVSPDLAATQVTGANDGPLEFIAKWQSEKS
jgi:hypothetical protein